MIRIHTGGCPVCGSPMFVDFKEAPPYPATRHVFQGRFFDGKVMEIIYSCECIAKEEE